MFNKYYMFSEEIDTKLKDLGFTLSQSFTTLSYENICQEGNSIVKYEINRNMVSAQELLEEACTRRYAAYLEDLTFEEIISKLERCLNDLKNRGIK